MNDYKSLNNAYKNNTRVQLNENYTATGCPASTYCPNSKEKQILSCGGKGDNPHDGKN